MKLFLFYYDDIRCFTLRFPYVEIHKWINKNYRISPTFSCVRVTIIKILRFFNISSLFWGIRVVGFRCDN